MSNLPEAVRAALKIVDVCEEVSVGAMAAIITAAFAPLVEERDQLQAKLDAMVGAGEALEPYFKSADDAGSVTVYLLWKAFHEALRKAKE